MFDEGSLQTIYRKVGDIDKIGFGETIFLTTECSNTVGNGEEPLVTEGQLKPTQNVTFGSTLVINNSNDASGEIRGNLANRNFVNADYADEDDGGAVALPSEYTYASGLQLIGGTEADGRTLTLVGDNSNFVGPLTIGDGTTAGVVCMGMRATGSAKYAIGGATNITVNPNAELRFQGNLENNVETNGNWDLYQGSKTDTQSHWVKLTPKST